MMTMRVTDACACTHVYEIQKFELAYTVREVFFFFLIEFDKMCMLR